MPKYLSLSDFVNFHSKRQGHFHRLLIIGVVCFALPARGDSSRQISFAESPIRGTQQELLLKQQLRQAVRSHPATLSAQAQLQSSNYRLSAAEWGRYPSMLASVSKANNGDQLQTLELRQPLWAGGRIDGSIDASRARALAAVHRVRETELDLAEQTVSAAVDVSRTIALTDTAKENLDALESLFQSIERRTEGGLGLSSDVTLARSRIESARTTLAQVGLARDQAIARWSSLTGGGSFRFELGDFLPPDLAGVDQLLRGIKAVSPQLARLAADADAAAGDAEVAKSSAWPQISIRHTQTRQQGEFDRSDHQTLAVIEFQPDAGFGVADNARAAELLRDSAVHQFAQAEREVEEKTRSLYAELVGLRGQVEANENSIVANRQIIESFIRQYNIGKRSWLDVLNAQRELFEAQQQRVEMRHRLGAAYFRLRLLNGHFFDE